MSTFDGLKWAWGLENIDPTSKLLAIYVGGSSGMSRYTTVNADDAAKFCGFRTIATGRRRPVDAVRAIQIALQGIPQITFEKTGDREFTVDAGDLFGKASEK